MSDRSRPPLRFVFGVHLHQPVGNFHEVVAQHARDVYRPFLEQAIAARFLPLTLHISGPLLEWLEHNDSTLLDTVGRLAADGQVEMLLSGFDEPILASLPRPDRIEQIARLREYIERRFGRNATAGGMWLTERVWVPSLAEDLAAAGITYTLVDDRHFLVSGFRREDLHRPYRTESNGGVVGLLAIDERLRYLIPFGMPADTAAYLRGLRAAGQPLAVLADDGEKFGGWPGTKEWVYERGWLTSFFREMEGLTTDGEMQLVKGSDAFREVPGGGLAYLGTASYREMEQWALPAAAQRELARLEEDLGERRMAEAAAFVRGGHWHNFFVKYPEANRMHKTMVALSALCRERGDPPAARRAIGRAQCNDAYWHGVFGGLYLPHLRHSVWHWLAAAERELRSGEPLRGEVVDIDCDGYDEIWVHSAQFSAIVSPQRGGTIETLLRFSDATNVADTLTRRRESYHVVKADKGAAANQDGAISIHEIERQARLEKLPPIDREPRALFVDRILPGSLGAEAYRESRYAPVTSWGGMSFAAAVEAADDWLTVTFKGHGLEKRLRFDPAGNVRASFVWDPAAYPEGAVFATELSFSREVPLSAGDADLWRHSIATVARSERGFDETVQGISVTARWPARLGEGACSLELELAGALAQL